MALSSPDAARVEGMLLKALGHKPLPRRVEIPAVSHTAELAELDAKITDLDEQFAEGNVPASAYGRMMTRLGPAAMSWRRCRSARPRPDMSTMLTARPSETTGPA